MLLVEGRGLLGRRVFHHSLALGESRVAAFAAICGAKLACVSCQKPVTETDLEWVPVGAQ